jgi:predicted DNA-binding transcriptional regulator AlpA
VSDELLGVDLAECCRRLGISRRTGERLVAEGRFPIPELPRLGQETSKRPRIRFSTYEIDLYLREASIEDGVTVADRHRYRLVRARR